MTCTRFKVIDSTIPKKCVFCRVQPIITLPYSLIYHFYWNKSKAIVYIIVSSQMSSDSTKIELSRNSSRHMSCRQLREKIEVEMDDNNSATVMAKRQLDEL